MPLRTVQDQKRNEDHLPLDGVPARVLGQLQEATESVEGKEGVQQFNEDFWGVGWWFPSPWNTEMVYGVTECRKRRPGRVHGGTETLPH